MGFSFTAHGGLVLPNVVNLFGHKAGDLGSNVSRRNGVGAGKLNPFNSQGFTCSRH
jgi:hypothetical protein